MGSMTDASQQVTPSDSVGFLKDFSCVTISLCSQILPCSTFSQFVEVNITPSTSICINLRFQILKFLNFLISYFQVNGFPTLNIYKDGEKVDEYNGKRAIDDLEAFVNKHLEPAAKEKDEL